MDVRTLGVNWYCYKDTKIMLNRLSQRFDRPANNFSQNGVAWSLRLQWEVDL